MLDRNLAWLPLITLLTMLLAAKLASATNPTSIADMSVGIHRGYKWRVNSDSPAFPTPENLNSSDAKAKVSDFPFLTKILDVMGPARHP